jgi:aryl-alcohol dehydrogenase-like predicted oxidoreductase
MISLLPGHQRITSSLVHDENSNRHQKYEDQEVQMQYSSLGNTGLKVSRLALGTVELGLDYGFRNSAHYRKPEINDAIRIVNRCLELGINFIDTARAYGNSEEILGVALQGKRDEVILASKVAINEHDMANSSQLRSSIEHSIEASLRALRVDAIDVLQIHNAQPEILSNEVILYTLEDAQKAGKIRFLGASCVGEQSANAALELPQIRTMMLPFNILDREMLPDVFSKMQSRGVGLLARSAFLRGVLTDNLATVPDALSAVKLAAAEAAKQCLTEAHGLSELALRYCLSFDAVSTVVIGVRTLKELESNVRSAEKGALSPDCIYRLSTIQVNNHDLVTPGTWQQLI